MNKPQKIVDFHLDRLVAHLGHRLVEERRQVVFVEKVGMWLWCVEIEPIFPHIFVWGSCFWFCIPPRLRPAFAPPPAPPSLSHTPSFHTQLCHKSSFTHTHNFVTHHLSHTTLSRTIFHTQLCHTPSVTHNFVTHHLSHTTLSHTPSFHTQLCHTPSFHTQLCHTPSFTHNFVTHHLSHTTLSHTIFPHTTLSHTIFHTQLCHTHHLSTHNFVTHHLSTHNFVTHHLSHTTLSHTIFHTQLCHTLSFRVAHLPSFCLADVALGAWQACHLWHWAGSGGALGAPWSVTLRQFAWQAWHLATSTVVLPGRRGTWRHRPWRAWHLWHWAGSGGALGAPWSRGDAAALCVAGVALGDMYRRFAWQAWHLATSTSFLRHKSFTHNSFRHN